MVRAFQYFGTAVWGYVMFSGAMNIAAEVSDQGSLTYILILAAFAPVAVISAVGLMWSTGTTALLRRILMPNQGKEAEPEAGRRD